jgi:hypothetical protein
MTEQKPELKTYNRLIPGEGIKISGILYRDVNDIGVSLRNEVHDFFWGDKDYEKVRFLASPIPKGTVVKRRYCLYGWEGDDLIGNVFYTEYLDNPDGYGGGDFFTHKLIYPNFRWTKYSRHISTNIMDIFFIKDLVRRIYSYVPVFKEGEAWDWWSRVDQRVPCFGRMYPTDGPSVQKYMSVKKVFTGEGNVHVLLIEMDGEKYRAMDWWKYFMTAPGREPGPVKAWMDTIKEAAEVVAQAMNEDTGNINGKKD